MDSLMDFFAPFLRINTRCISLWRTSSERVAIAFLIVFGTLLLPALLSVEEVSARERIRIVGSSTVFPFATVVAERFALAKGLAPPIVESTGTGGGIKLFCSGASSSRPDIVNASSRITPSQLQLCIKNGVNEVVEVAIGYDGIVIAQARESKQMGLTLRQLYLALAKQVPSASDGFMANPYHKWSDIDSSLPPIVIEVMGPPPTSGTRIAFNENVMDIGARSFPRLAALRRSDKSAFKKAVYALREDGAYIDSGENDNLIVQKLRRNPKALGIFGFSFLDKNRSILRGLKIENISPEFANIADGSYPIARSLYFYINAMHDDKISNLLDYANTFFGDEAISEDGFLIDEGLIPLPDAELKRVRYSISSMRTISAADLK